MPLFMSFDADKTTVSSLSADDMSSLQFGMAYAITTGVDAIKDPTGQPR
jgi:hypothetical protein